MKQPATSAPAPASIPYSKINLDGHEEHGMGFNIGMACSRPTAGVAFTPSADQSRVVHLYVTVERISTHPGGWRALIVVSGVGFGVFVPPGLPIAVNDRLTLEYEEEKSNPFKDPYIAIYVRKEEA
jgi:hypothetical protein